jgi:methyltransferase (TIGR00027 family)
MKNMVGIMGATCMVGQRYAGPVPAKESFPFLSDVSETMLLTLFGRAMESVSRDPLLSDPKAVEIIEKLRPQLAASEKEFYRFLAAGKLGRRAVVYMSLRARKFDRYAKEFIRKNPGAVVVNLGCGLDTRFFRIDDGKTFCYDLDLPDVIAIKKTLLSESDRYRFIASSVLDRAWTDELKAKHSGPFIFIAEGLFMYLPKEEIKSLVSDLCNRFPGSELVCEVVKDFMIKTPVKQMANFKMRRQLHLGKGAQFVSSVSGAREMEEWNPKTKFLDDWSYFDEDEKKLGILRLFRRIPFLRNTQWVVHYVFER